MTSMKGWAEAVAGAKGTDALAGLLAAPPAVASAEDVGLAAGVLARLGLIDEPFGVARAVHEALADAAARPDAAALGLIGGHVLAKAFPCHGPGLGQLAVLSREDALAAGLEPVPGCGYVPLGHGVEMHRRWFLRAQQAQVARLLAGTLARDEARGQKSAPAQEG